MGADTRLRKYGVEATIDFEVYEIDGVDLRTDWTPAAADCEVMKDGGASTQCTNTATDEGSTFSIVLTATEMQAARLVLKVVDAATKVFLDRVIVIETYGHASAQHAFDLDTAAETMRGTDSAALASGYTAARAALLDELDAANLPTDIAAIPTTAMRGTDSASTHDAAAVLSAIQAAGTHLTLIKAVTDLLPNAGALNDLATTLTAIQHATYGLSALRTRGDSAWITAAGFSTHDAAAVKTAIEAGGSSLATLLTRITAALETKGEADTAHALLATAAALTTHDGKLDTVDGVADAIKLITDKFDAARPEPSQGQPPKNPTFWEFMAWLWMGFRNKEEETASEKALYNDAGTKLAKATLADDATTFSKAKFISGA